MILQELCEYYDILAADEKCDIPQEGYSNAKISYALNISRDGELKNILSLKVPADKGNKEIYRLMTVPEQVKRSSGVETNFLCDNAKYVFGISKDKKNPVDIFEKHFEAFKNFHIEIFKDCEDEGANAILKFLENWDIQNAEETLKDLSQDYEDFLQGANFIFRLDDDYEYIHQRKNIKDLWTKYKNQNKNGEIGQCLITGKETQIALLHENLKNVRGAQPAGAAIVSFNIPSFISYGKKQSYNAPVGIESAFKYTTVLNYMLQSGSSQKIQIGDATTVFWADFPKSKYVGIVNGALNSNMKSEDKKTEEEKLRDSETEKLVKSCFKALNAGKPLSDVDEEIYDDAKFYILGLSPNNARVAIRFFHQSTFGDFLKNLAQHHEDMELDGKPKHLEHIEYIPVWIILDEIIPKNSKNKNHNALLTGKIMSSIVTGSNYPDNFLTAVLSRIRAEQDISHLRASIIKAYLARKARKDKNVNLQEVLKVSLNEETANPAYRLGRLFALLERIQLTAQGDINATIKDRYFSSASVSPVRVFSNLIRLSQHHMAKEPAKTKWLEIEMSKVLDGIEKFPPNLSIEDQGLFILGYYHQRQSFFKKREEVKEPALAN